MWCDVTRCIINLRIQKIEDITRQYEDMNYLPVVKTIFYERAQRVSKILFSPREDKIPICKPPCNTLFII